MGEERNGRPAASQGRTHRAMNELDAVDAGRNIKREQVTARGFGHLR